MEELHEKCEILQSDFNDKELTTPTANTTEHKSSPSSPSVWYSSLLTSLYNSRYREHNNNTEEEDHNNNDKKGDTNTSKEENSSGKFSLASNHNRKYEGQI